MPPDSPRRRSVQKKKCVRICSCRSFPRSEALVSPITVRMSTHAEASRNCKIYIRTMRQKPRSLEYITQPPASTVAQSLTVILKFTRFRSVKNQRRVNAFHYVRIPPAWPMTGLLRCGLRNKVNTFLLITQKMFAGWGIFCKFAVLFAKSDRQRPGEPRLAFQRKVFIYL